MNPTELQHSLRECFPRRTRFRRNAASTPRSTSARSCSTARCRSGRGQTRPVFSPVRTRAADGTLTPVELGSFPVTGIGRPTPPSRPPARPTTTAAAPGPRCRWPSASPASRTSPTSWSPGAPRSSTSSWEIGKSLADSQKEFDRTIDYIKATVAELKQLDNSNSRFQIVDGTIAQIRRSPLGIVLCLGPYNYPMNETFCTLIPALIMGNAVLFKPPRFGVLLYNPMLEAFRSAFPAGAINIVYGQGSVVVPHIMASGKVNVLALIGTSKVADGLKKAHPKTNRLRAVLGLEAKNAAIILPDADIEADGQGCLAGSLSFNGQRCTALKMILVHQSIAEQFLRRFSDELAKLKMGMPWEKGVMITPLPEMGKVAYMNRCIEGRRGQGRQGAQRGRRHLSRDDVLSGGAVPRSPKA